VSNSYPNYGGLCPVHLEFFPCRFCASAPGPSTPPPDSTCRFCASAPGPSTPPPDSTPPDPLLSHTEAMNRLTVVLERLAALLEQLGNAWMARRP
jgi:hypothetical protein